MAFTFRAIEAGATAETGFAAAANQFARASLGEYAAARGKSRWCDKSLVTVDQVQYVATAFPNARYLCLYRDCADMTLSAIEASPWGYGGYGFAPYVSSAPGNFVLAIFNYWADRIVQMLAFEDAHPDRCLRLRYEDLVAKPEIVIREVSGFLDAAWEPTQNELNSLLERHDVSGPGDYKIAYTHAVTADSVGRGRRSLPILTVPGPVLDRINELHAKLGYEPIGRDQSRTQHGAGRGGAVRDCSQIIDKILPERLSTLAHYSDIGPRAVNFVITDTQIEVCLNLERRTVEPYDPLVPIMVELDRDSLLGMLDGRVNPGVAIRHGWIRITANGNPQIENTEHMNLPAFFNLFIQS